MAITFFVTNDQFKDLDMDMTIHPVTRDLMVKKNVQAIIQSVRNIILTVPGERPFKPQLGSNIYTMLFENWTFDQRNLVEREIQSTVERYEPRAKILGVAVDDQNIDLNQIAVHITFAIQGVAEPVTITTIIERSR